jgi:hypothetical protein
LTACAWLFEHYWQIPFCFPCEETKTRPVGTAIAVQQGVFKHRLTFVFEENLIVEGVIKLMANKATLVTGLFKTRAAAEAAVDALMKRGYTREEISVLMSDATKSKEFAVETRTHAADGAGIGGAVGGTIGAVLAAIVAVGTSIAIPGLGLVVAGPIAAALAGAGAGAAAGGIIGALIGAGIPEHRARVYEAGLRSGGILLGVEARSDTDADNLQKFLEDLGAEHVRQE